MHTVVLMRLACLTVSNVFGVRLLPVGDRDKDAEILALRHRLGVLQRPLIRSSRDMIKALEA